MPVGLGSPQKNGAGIQVSIEHKDQSIDRQDRRETYPSFLQCPPHVPDLAAARQGPASCGRAKGQSLISRDWSPWTRRRSALYIEQTLSLGGRDGSFEDGKQESPARRAPVSMATSVGPAYGAEGQCFSLVTKIKPVKLFRTERALWFNDWLKKKKKLLLPDTLSHPYWSLYWLQIHHTSRG